MRPEINAGMRMLLGILLALMSVPEATAAAVVDEAESNAVNEATDLFGLGPLQMAFDGVIRADAASNFRFADFTYTPERDNHRLIVRLRPALALTAADGMNLRLEGQWYATYDDEDFDRLSLYQAYGEGRVPAVSQAVLKAGRQELVYGSTFLLGADTFFDGLAFDAVKVRMAPTETSSIDFFAGRYASESSGGIKGELYGIYGTWVADEHISFDLYGLADTGGIGLTHRTKGHERTYSVGTRAAVRLGKLLALEVEPIYQFGRRNTGDSSHDDIRAFGGHADLILDPLPGRHREAILSYAFGSGDGNESDGGFHEFHNPNNDTALIGDMSIIGDLSGLTVANPTTGDETAASGLHVITIGGGLDISEKLGVSLDGHYFTADKTPDGVSKDIGLEVNLIVTLDFSERVSLLASANHFFTGTFFEQAAGSGKDVTYGYLQMQATY